MARKEGLSKSWLLTRTSQRRTKFTDRRAFGSFFKSQTHWPGGSDALKWLEATIAMLRFAATYLAYKARSAVRLQDWNAKKPRKTILLIVVTHIFCIHP